MGEIEDFFNEVRRNVESLRRAPKVRALSIDWIRETAPYKYSYNFTWMGRPIIQFPQDMIAMQEIIWQVKPDLIIETGIAHGGSLVYYAALLELNGGKGEVLGVDIDIREHNRREIEKHPMSRRIRMIQGSSVAPETVEQVRKAARGRRSVLVILDSNHTHEHVLQELKAYSPLVTTGSYLVVFDTVVEEMPADFFPDRPWGKGDNPRTAVLEFLRSNDRFVVDEQIEAKLLITVAPGGSLRCVKD
jgi:cephalosporin hydroxylase